MPKEEAIKVKLLAYKKAVLDYYGYDHDEIQTPSGTWPIADAMWQAAMVEAERLVEILQDLCQPTRSKFDEGFNEACDVFKEKIREVK